MSSLGLASDRVSTTYKTKNIFFGRFMKLLIWDMRFQMRYGFYLLYTFLTIFYVLVLTALPEAWKGKTAAILIFSDPAAMGLFFMGAIVLLEKSQRVTSYFAVSPVKAFEYVCSKVLSLSAIALIVAGILSKASGCGLLVPALSGTLLASVMFTLFGVIVATKIISLNQFILFTVPVEMFGFIPAIMHLLGVTPSIFRIYPANACMELIGGMGISVVGIFLTIVLIVVLFVIACRCVFKMWQEQGGVKI
ncbi:ABC transporter permease [Butyrivibrio sp. VCD2006]|uniref:ABC transporter permease n=1 Tax=Butyrivibrio sp. VCD2006 TaxID=1280664 RepID=UPI001FA6C982|nr:ABC transporter permease [Butyrivibrio sp. VCD2006]